MLSTNYNLKSFQLHFLVKTVKLTKASSEGPFKKEAQIKTKKRSWKDGPTKTTITNRLNEIIKFIISSDSLQNSFSSRHFPEIDAIALGTPQTSRPGHHTRSHGQSTEAPTRPLQGRFSMMNLISTSHQNPVVPGKSRHKISYNQFPQLPCHFTQPTNSAPQKKRFIH